MATRFVIEGQNAGRVFAQLGRLAVTKIDKAVEKSALIVLRDAKIFCPVDTGRLRASIAYRLLQPNPNKITAQVGTNVEYAKDVEYGTSRRPAKPFLLKALTVNRNRIQRIIDTAILETLQGR